MSQDHDRQLRARGFAPQRKTWLFRLYLVLRFAIRTWQRLPLSAMGVIVAAAVLVSFLGAGNIAEYIPSPSGLYHFFRPVKHRCSQTYDFKTGRMVWADDGSPADPPMAGYTWDAFKCEYVAPPQLYMRR